MSTTAQKKNASLEIFDSTKKRLIMKKLSNLPNRTNESPWLDPTKSNMFRDEFQLIEDIKLQPEIQNGHPYFEPLEIFKWIHKNNGVGKLYKALAQFAPMYQVVAYKGGVASIAYRQIGKENIHCVTNRDKTKKVILLL